jgi:hypothetical protein
MGLIIIRTDRYFPTFSYFPVILSPPAPVATVPHPHTRTGTARCSGSGSTAVSNVRVCAMLTDQYLQHNYLRGCLTCPSLTAAYCSSSSASRLPTQTNTRSETQTRLHKGSYKSYLGKSGRPRPMLLPSSAAGSSTGPSSAASPAGNGTVAAILVGCSSSYRTRLGVTPTDTARSGIR